MNDKKIPTLDTLFGGCSTETKENNKIEMLETDTLFPYSEHPFLVKDNDDLKELIQSIKDEGILIPLLVRVHPAMKGKFEILAGHRRHTAASIVGIEQVPCVIRNVDDDTATLIVIESNKQRGFSDMLPSEIAKALKLEHDALKCQGRRTDLFNELEDILNERKTAEKSTLNADDNEVCATSRPMVGKLSNKSKYDFTERSRQRYIRLTYLIPDLLELVDSNKIAVRPAVDLSFLSSEEQETVFWIIKENVHKIDGKKAETLKQYSRDKKFSVKVAEDIITGRYFKKPAKKATAIKLPYKSLSNYLDTSLSQKEVEEYILKALEFYKQNVG